MKSSFISEFVPPSLQATKSSPASSKEQSPEQVPGSTIVTVMLQSGLLKSVIVSSTSPSPALPTVKVNVIGAP